MHCAELVRVLSLGLVPQLPRLPAFLRPVAFLFTVQAHYRVSAVSAEVSLLPAIVAERFALTILGHVSELITVVTPCPVRCRGVYWDPVMLFYRVHRFWFLLPFRSPFDFVPSSGLFDQGLHCGDVHCVQLVLEFSGHLGFDVLEFRPV